MGTYTTGLEQQGIGALQALGAENQMLEQQKLNQLALGAQQGYQLPMQRVQDVANIYGGIAGAMPGSPSQQFQPTATSDRNRWRFISSLYVGNGTR